MISAMSQFRRMAAMRHISLSFFFALLVFHAAHAEDLGTIGPVYPIAEADLIEVMKGQFKAMEKTGELAKMDEAYKKRIVNYLENPRPVPGIKPTEVSRTFYVDPTWTLEHNIVDGSGKVMFQAGTKVNPFDYDKMSSNLLFFDASSKDQVEFAKRYIAQSKITVKPVLVAGQPFKLMRDWKARVYYDQGGALSKKFSIQNTPSIVSQEGKMIRVDEIRL